MDHFKVLKRAFEITWRYKALWVFGLILALVIARGGGNRVQYTVGGEDFQSPNGEFRMPEMPQFSPEVGNALIAIAIGLGCLVLVLAVLSVIARYVARTALIRMVDDYEETGERHGVGWGFRAGWSRAAWRLFLIDLLIAIPVTLALVLLFMLAIAPLLLWLTERLALGILGTVTSIGLIFLFVLLVIVVVVALWLLRHFIRRICVLEGEGVTDAIRRGLIFGRRHVADIGIMALLVLGLSIAWLLLTIPVIILLVLSGIFLGGVPALVAGLLVNQIIGGPLPWIVGGLVALPIFLLVVVAPLTLLEGLTYVYSSTTWTLTYRELRALEALDEAPASEG